MDDPINIQKHIKALKRPINFNRNFKRISNVIGSIIVGQFKLIIGTEFHGNIFGEDRGSFLRGEIIQWPLPPWTRREGVSDQKPPRS